ncbi:MAG: restriction endonuclease subunit S [Deferrisomatales bacterium]
MEFDQFTTLKRGKDLTRGQFREGSIPVAGSNGPIGYHDTANVQGPGVTVGRSGSVGRVTYYAQDFWAHNTSLFVTDFHGNHPRFAAYFLDFLKLGRFGSGASVPTLDRNVFRQLSVPVPPLPEQRKIAGVLGVVQRAMEQQERLLALTTELKKALLHRLFTAGLRGEPQKETEIGLVPESWEVVPLGAAFHTQLGKMLSQKARVGNAPRPYLRNKNVQWGRIDVTDLLKMDFDELELAKYRLVIGDLLVCEGGEPGRAALWNGAIGECYYQKALHRLRPKDNRFTNLFLAHWLMFSIKLQNLYGVAGASSTIAHLPEVQLKALPIPRPTRVEQDEICVILEGADKKLDVVEKRHAALTALFRTLLHQLMTAELRVHDLDLPALGELP